KILRLSLFDKVESNFAELLTDCRLTMIFLGIWRYYTASYLSYITCVRLSADRKEKIRKRDSSEFWGAGPQFALVAVYDLITLCYYY
ncbi:MAG TPA: hypothetical protein VI033_03355, partial [Candidatus Nitrosopolaris sp.]